MSEADEIKIKADNICHLNKKMYGRRDCTIVISYFCSKEIKEMDFLDYLELEEELKIRNIELKLEE